MLPMNQSSIVESEVALVISLWDREVHIRNLSFEKYIILGISRQC